ncbi:2',5'-phosphodiesterase 12 [Episyrphus balteatus]|uniref:2',5'-phosphodiesterase 12 n=1 Tax=Episyrphus balteatus TaxID=286459 RepID=UPI0024851443|nr:2',5'-phosphodiesterase 12 [Episyrphus balteatus]
MLRQVDLAISTIYHRVRFQSCNNLYRNFASQAHKTKIMNKVYFRNEPGSAELQISFRYKNPEMNVDREFNFCRTMTENIDDALVRIRNNISKELNKKSKKKQKKPKQQSQPEDGTATIPIANKAEVVQDIAVDFIQSNEKLSSVTFAQMIADSKELSLQVLDDKFEVVVNNPWVCNLVLPQSILAGFIVYPTKMELQFSDRKHSIGTWYKGKKPSSGNLQQIEWIKCGTGLSYTTSTADIGYLIKLELQPGNANCLGPLAEAISKNEVQAGPGKCPFEERHIFTENRLSGDQFRVVSYNILADLYADSEHTRTFLFPYCPPYALSLDYRRQLFIKEIIGYNGDIMCLQEVDTKVFDLDLKPILLEKGYQGLMQQKGSSGEGVATFYRSDRFEMIRTMGMNIGENVPTLPVFRELWEKIKDNSKLVERLVERATTLQLSILKSKETGKILCIANTHLYFHPDADHIRLLQVGFSMLYIENILKKLPTELATTEDNISLVFCGDFNSVPECGIYKLMTEKFVDSDYIDWRSNAEEAVRNVTLSQPFSIASACGTPKYTNFTHAFAACLDYIFYQTDRLTVEEVIPLPSDEQLKTHTAIPSVVFPSDHVALVTVLKFKT